MKTEKNSKTTPRKPSQTKKIIKWIIILIILAGICAVAYIYLPKLLKKEEVSTRVVTYNAEEITYGSVSTTISGSGNLSPVSKETFTAEYAGEVTAVKVKAGDEVKEDDVIAKLTYTIIDRRGNESTEDAEITAPYDGIILEVPVAKGDELSQGAEICMMMGKDGFSMSISVDELNIAYIALNQEVKYTIDAVSGDYTGKVASISYNGSTSGNTTSYQIQGTLDYVEGVYPGMSATAEITIEDSGEGLLVPVDAVYTSGDTKYVYLAPSDAEAGTEYPENEMDTSALTKVIVTTGMSDGTYIMIESDELKEGDCIIIKKVTSTANASDSKSESSSGFPGGGSFPGGEGGFNFGGGSFDFSNFDPSNRPSGGFPGGN